MEICGIYTCVSLNKLSNAVRYINEKIHLSDVDNADCQSRQIKEFYSQTEFQHRTNQGII